MTTKAQPAGEVHPLGEASGSVPKAPPPHDKTPAGAYVITYTNSDDIDPWVIGVRPRLEDAEKAIMDVVRHHLGDTFKITELSPNQIIYVGHRYEPGEVLVPTGVRTYAFAADFMVMATHYAFEENVLEEL